MTDIIKSYFNKNNLLIKQLTGGVTNQVYLVENNNKKYIFKIYGKNLSDLFPRNNEIIIIHYLNKYDIGPKIISSFLNYRVEEYTEGLPNTNPLLYQDELCKIISKLHKIPINININYFWIRFNTWKMKCKYPYNNKINKLFDKINKLDTFWNDDVIGHGDLSLGNIIKSKNSIHLIDFEYSCILPRAFDLANHLCEYDGLNIKISSYPKENIRINLIKNYCKYINIKYKSNYLRIIDLYSLISHYYWGCWAKIQSQSSELEFDYEKY